MVNYVANEDVANASDVLLGAGGAISVQSVAMTHLVIDVYGYFTDVEELGNGNTALGVGALLTTPRGRTPPWGQRPQSNTMGIGNTATGASALAINTTGSNNTATGVTALLSNTTGGTNTATGVAALSNNTTGGGNTATGSAPSQQHHGHLQHRRRVAALLSNTTGSQQHRHRGTAPGPDCDDGE